MQRLIHAPVLAVMALAILSGCPGRAPNMADRARTVFAASRTSPRRVENTLQAAHKAALALDRKSEIRELRTATALLSRELPAVGWLGVLIVADALQELFLDISRLEHFHHPRVWEVDRLFSRVVSALAIVHIRASLAFTWAGASELARRELAAAHALAEASLHWLEHMATDDEPVPEWSNR